MMNDQKAYKLERELRFQLKRLELSAKTNVDNPIHLEVEEVESVCQRISDLMEALALYYGDQEFDL